MEFRITDIDEQYLIGRKILTTMVKDETKELWQSFKRRLSEIEGRVNENFYSVQVYPADLDISSFTPNTEFEKWAAVAVSNLSPLPDGMDQLTIPSGLYAVFIHKGPLTTFNKTIGYIFQEWLPSSEFDFDHRPQFEIMDHRYMGPLDEESQEEVWIPIKKK